ncbi:MAG TPA: hypothetical protein H9836_18215 [Candidatus Nocardiopsis merdipullorum]|nr:hypothetical protein [Candidatus Nocardiopsis merdipullorum]
MDPAPVAPLRSQALGRRRAQCPGLQVKSRHAHLAILGKYVRLGEEASARITTEHDPHRRRR